MVGIGRRMVVEENRDKSFVFAFLLLVLTFDLTGPNWAGLYGPNHIEEMKNTL